MSTSARAALFLFLGAVAPLAACSGDEEVAPVDEGGGGSSSASSTTAGSSSSTSSQASSSSTGGGPVLRTVSSRNPFGDQVGNLLADGDFELSFGFAGQQGWTAFSNTGQLSLVAETGGLCDSGLRCARLAPGAVLFGRGTSAAGERQMRATVRAKPASSGGCGAITAFAIGCESFLTRGVLTAMLGADERGWCTYSGTVAASKVAACLYIENEGAEPVLFDAATMVPVEPDEPTPPAPVMVAARSSAQAARMERVRRMIRDTLPIGAPRVGPPSASRRGGLDD